MIDPKDGFDGGRHRVAHRVDGVNQGLDEAGHGVGKALLLKAI